MAVSVKPGMLVHIDPDASKRLKEAKIGLLKEGWVLPPGSIRVLKIVDRKYIEVVAEYRMYDPALEFIGAFHEAGYDVDGNWVMVMYESVEEYDKWPSVVKEKVESMKHIPQEKRALYWTVGVDYYPMDAFLEILQVINGEGK